jgi:hypothetical protein
VQVLWLLLILKLLFGDLYLAYPSSTIDQEDEEGEGAENKGRKERVSCALERKGSEAR